MLLFAFLLLSVVVMSLCGDETSLKNRRQSGKYVERLLGKQSSVIRMTTSTRSPAKEKLWINFQRYHIRDNYVLEDTDQTRLLIQQEEQGRKGSR